jgi:hypothetical protein
VVSFGASISDLHTDGPVPGHCICVWLEALRAAMEPLVTHMVNGALYITVGDAITLPSLDEKAHCRYAHLTAVLI